MNQVPVVDPSLPTREIRRLLRRASEGRDDCLPESIAWHAFHELKTRGEPDVTPMFVGALKRLHSRRTLGAVDLGFHDPLRDEHLMADDPYLAELWKAYKKCIEGNRTGPASQLLRDIEERLGAA